MIHRGAIDQLSGRSRGPLRCNLRTVCGRLHVVVLVLPTCLCCSRSSPARRCDLHIESESAAERPLRCEVGSGSLYISIPAVVVVYVVVGLVVD